MTDTIHNRLEYIRKQIQDECISYAEIVELQSFIEYIDENDVELLEWAWVREYTDRVLYLQLCTAIPNMLMYWEWEIDMVTDDETHVYIHCTIDWEIDIQVTNWDEEWGWVITVDDWEELVKDENFASKEAHKLIQAKIEFAYELCHEF